MCLLQSSLNIWCDFYCKIKHGFIRCADDCVFLLFKVELGWTWWHRCLWLKILLWFLFWQNPEQTQATQQHDAYWDWVICNVNWGGGGDQETLIHLSLLFIHVILLSAAWRLSGEGAVGWVPEILGWRVGRQVEGRYKRQAMVKVKPVKQQTFFCIIVVDDCCPRKEYVFVLNRPPKCVHLGGWESTLASTAWQNFWS